MAGSFRIAEGYVEVTADESSYDRAMARLEGKKHTVKVGVQLDDTAALAQLTRFARDRIITAKVNLDQTALAALGRNLKVEIAPNLNDAAVQRVTKALDKLTADRVVQIRANADTRVAADEIRNLTRRQQVRIGIDVDTRVAADSIANLTRRRTMTVAANLNSTEARARIDALTRDRRMNVNVNVDRSALSMLTSLGSGGGGGGGLGILSSRIAQIAAAALGALPTIASLGQSLIAMAPAAAIAAPAVLSLGAAFAAIKIGTSGIGDAFKAAFAPAASSASTALSATKAVEAAQRSLAKAQVGVKDAEVNAATARVKAARDIKDAQLALKNTVVSVADANRRAVESVTRAERDLATAQRAEKQAQEDLTQARKDAKQQLEDLNNQLADAHLNERDDILAVQDAQQNLDAAKAKGASATAEELAKAQLEYDKAVQALKEQQIATARLEEQTAAANAAGVDGSAAVVTAEQGVTDAKQNTADQTQALTDAQIQATRTATDGAQQVAKAQRDVADAQAAATKAATDGSRAIADAQAAVADAARAVADAQTSAALKTDKLGQAMAKLSTNAREFVNAVIAQKGAWTALKLDVQNRLFAGLGDKFTTMANAVLPSLREGLTGTAGVLNTMAKNAADTVTELGKTGALKKLFAGLNDGLKPLSKVPGQFIKGLTQIGIAASPAFKKLTTAAGGFADRISKQLDTAFKNGHLEKVIDQAIDIAKQFGKLIGDIFGTVGNVMKAASAGGGDALGALGAVFKELRRITAMPEVQKMLTTIFKAINDVAKLLAGALGAAIQAVLPVLALLAPVVSGLAKQLGPVVAQIFKALGPVLIEAAKAVGNLVTAFEPLLPVVGNVISELLPVLTPILKTLSEIFVQLAPVIKQVADQIGPILTPIVKTLSQVFGLLAPVITQIAGAIGPILTPIIAGLGKVLNQMVSQYAAMFMQVLQQLIPLIPQLIPVVIQLAQSIGEILTQLAPLLPQIMLLSTQMITQLLPAILPLVPPALKLAEMFLKIGTAIAVHAIGALTDLVGWFKSMKEKLQPAIDAVKYVAEWIADKFNWLYDHLVGHSVVPDMVNAIIHWFTSLWDKTKKIFTDLKNGVVNLWNALWNSVRSKWNDFWSGLKNAVSGAWTSLKNGVSSLRTSISNTWTGMWNSIRDKASAIFTSIRNKVGDFKNAMKTAFSTLRDSLGSIWNGIRTRFSNPIKFVIGSVYNDGVRKMWNTIASKISSKITLPAIKLGFNSGGIVPGSGNRDTVPAMLTPNERILSNQQVARLGGHRAIDAMLGMDRSTGTGGNPTRQQERTRQGAQAFADGGIVGTISDLGKQAVGALGSGLDWAKDLVLGGLKAAAQKAISSIVRPLINRIPAAGPLGGLIKAIPSKALNNMLAFLGNEDGKAVGGPAVQKALGWAKTQNGLPYQWGGNGNPSWDCSGLMSAIESVIRGESPHRRWATGSFSGSSGPAGWVRNLVSPFQIGVTHAGVGHTAGTIGGVNAESRGGDGVIIGKGARGYNDSLFTSRWGFEPATKFDSGGLLTPGATMAVNATGAPERVLSAEHTAKLDALLSAGAVGGVSVQAININGSFDFNTPASRKQAANALVKEMKEALRRFDKDRI